MFYFLLCFYIYFGASYCVRVSGNFLFRTGVMRERRAGGRHGPEGQRRSTGSEFPSQAIVQFRVRHDR